MFKRVIHTVGFWKSVFSIGTAFVLLFVLVKWAIDGFKSSFFVDKDPAFFILGSLVAGFAYGFFVTYGKFQKKIKEEDLKK